MTIKEQIMQEIMKKINRLSDNDETHANISYLLCELEIKTLTQLENLVSDYDGFIRIFCEKMPFLDDKKTDAKLACDELKKLIKECKSKFEQEQPFDVAKFGVYADYDLSEELVRAIENTDKQTTVLELPFFNPFENYDERIKIFLGKCSVYKLKQTIVSTNGDIARALNKLGLADQKAAYHKALQKSLGPALDEYGRMQIRNAQGRDIGNGSNCDLWNVPEMNKKKQFLAFQMRTISQYVLRQKPEQCIFKSGKKGILAMKFIDDWQYKPIKEQAIEYVAHLLTLEECYEYDKPQEDILDRASIKTGLHKTKTRKPPIARIFIKDK